VPLSAGKDTASAASVSVDRLYELTLLPQGQVAFATTPGKASANEGAYAGLAELRLDAPATTASPSMHRCGSTWWQRQAVGPTISRASMAVRGLARSSHSI